MSIERYFGPSAVTFNSYQNALTAIVEVLGFRVPVVMPVTASPDALAAVLRGGGEPILLDICPDTLQMDPQMLREVLDEIKAAAVILTRPGGQPVDPALHAITHDVPTILDSRLPAHTRVAADCCCTFNVFNLPDVGALVIHKFSQQVTELKRIRSGVLGLSAEIVSKLDEIGCKRLAEDQQQTQRTPLAAAQVYMELLGEKYAYPFSESPEWPYFIVAVDNADRVVAHLHSHGIIATKPVMPLHMLSEINSRWVEKPSYPTAEYLAKKLVALPTNSGIIGSIVTLLGEVNT